MPDIIEENDDASVVERRAHEAAIRAAAAADNNNVNANNNNNNHNAAQAVPVAPLVAAVVAVGAAGVVGAANNNNNNHPDNNDNAGNNNNNDNPTELPTVANEVARLVGVDVRAMFRRLGVRRTFDIRYIREKDFDVIPRITTIQKRKLWALMKYVANNHPLTSQTSLKDVATALNQQKKREKEETPPSATGTGTGSASANTGGGTSIMPMSPVAIKLDSFDGSCANWTLWRSKSYYAIAQAPPIFALIQEREDSRKLCKQYPGRDHLLFNILAEAIVGGSARHLIRKAQKQTTAENHNKNRPASGRILWRLLKKEYTEGPNKFWILSTARQVLQRLLLVSKLDSVTTDNNTSAIVDANNQNDDNDANEFMTYSASDYVNRFRHAKETLEEYHQALPDPFLASSFVEHIYDEERFYTVKQQLLQDLSIKNLSLDDCINELLMADHMRRTRPGSSANVRSATTTGCDSGNARQLMNGSSRKRSLDEHQETQGDDTKRLKSHNNNDNGQGGDDGAAAAGGVHEDAP